MCWLIQLWIYSAVFYVQCLPLLVQFRLTVLERTVFAQMWENLINETPYLTPEDFSVDDRDDIGPPG